MAALGAGGRRRRAQPGRPAVGWLTRHSGRCRGGSGKGSRSSGAPCWWHEAAGADEGGPRTRARTRRARREPAWAAHGPPSPLSRIRGHGSPSGAGWRRDVDGTASRTRCGEPEVVRVGARCDALGPVPRKMQATPGVSRRLRTMCLESGWKARVLAVRPFPRGLDVRWWCPISRHRLAAREPLRPSSSRRAAAGAIVPVPQDDTR